MHDQGSGSGSASANASAADETKGGDDDEDDEDLFHAASSSSSSSRSRKRIRRGRDGSQQQSGDSYDGDDMDFEGPSGESKRAGDHKHTSQPHPYIMPSHNIPSHALSWVNQIVQMIDLHTHVLYTLPSSDSTLILTKP